MRRVKVIAPFGNLSADAVADQRLFKTSGKFWSIVADKVSVGHDHELRIKLSYYPLHRIGVAVRRVIGEFRVVRIDDFGDVVAGNLLSQRRYRAPRITAVIASADPEPPR